MRKIFAFLFALLVGGFSRVLLAQGQAANHINFTSFCRGIIPWLFFLFVLPGPACWTAAAQAGQEETETLTNVWNRALAEKTSQIFHQLPPAAKHYAGLSEGEAIRLLESDVNYQKLIEEKVERKWFAALVTWEDPEPYSIVARFDTWHDMVESLAEKGAVVDVWAYGEASEHKPRRIPGPELAELKHQPHEQPTFLTVTYVDQRAGRAVSYQLEFGFQAAEAVLAASRAYQRHRSLELSAHKILAARNAKGLPDATTQWTALQNEVRERNFPLSEVPAQPADVRDVFVAFEFAVDDQNNYSNAVHIVRDSEVQKKVIGNIQVLSIRKAGAKSARQVVGFRRLGLSDSLQPATNAILGQDVVELRVRDPAQPDPRKWNVVEFGEPEALKQSALAHFAQLNAYLERKRKAQAMKQANVALVAEPIIAGLNIGGGLALLGFPSGDAARLLYNVITWRLISDVPTAKQMRELFALMAARDRDPSIKLQPERFLTGADIQTLKELGRKLSDQEVQTYLQRMSDEDVRAMLRLARQGMIDARVTTFLNTLTSAFKVSGVSDEAGPIRDVFNNVRFSVNGDINVSTLLLLALGQEKTTPLSGISLRTLSRGEGSQQAWLQYLVLSVDIRAVLNTIVRLTKGSEAKKELEKPFPYAPRMDELAAYEVRIFGFPLLMFYKRSLMKADREAYEHDYAYGLRGVRLVEHFRTREDMEVEIRAGRMFPLGLVKVPSPKGGWKETDLVVYAHRIPNGKSRGKTALVIYGLKAYADYSDLIGRELIRFRQFEQGLRDGAVIERRVWDPASLGSGGRSFEPVIHVGSNAVQEIYSPLLGNLLELRRHQLRRSWGLQADAADVEQARQRLATLGVEAVEPDPLVEIDPYQSSFIYRRRIGGRPQTVQVTRIPSLEGIDREMHKAEEGKLIEEIRAEAAEGKRSGVVLLNEARTVQGHLEIGPLLRNPQGAIVGAGLTSGAKAIEEIFELINRLPVADRARLRANHFAATAIELERHGKEKEKVFLTIGFPSGETRQELANPLTGERESVVYSNGLWLRTITDQRILEIRYDAARMETGSRTYANLGSRQAPVQGVLLEETKTLECWLRDFAQPDLDPYQPTIAKLRINYVTGQLTRETYGLFSLPVEMADDQYVTRNRYTRYGLLESATTFDNGRHEADVLRASPTKVLEPIIGTPRFQYSSRLADNAERRDLSAAGYRMVVDQRDLIKGLVKTQTFDNAHYGRKVQEEHVDPFDGTQSFSSAVTWEYSEDYHFGLVPRRALTSSFPSGTRLAEAITMFYDPLVRRLTSSEINYTGRWQTNVWDYRWAAPVAVETLRRKTVHEYNREETVSHSTTTVKATGEILHQAAGEYDATHKTWRVTRQVWYRPGIPDRVETNTYSAFGMLISSRVGNLLETLPTYTSEGIEQASRTFARNAASGRYDVLNRQQDDYHWESSGGSARVQIFVEGSLGDEYRAITDEEGRVIQDGIRAWPPLDLKTVLTYDGDSDRVLKSEALQNGQVRATCRPLGVVRRPAGDWVLPVEVVPVWGLVHTNSYILGDPVARMVETEFENRHRSRVLEWFSNTGVARSTEGLDRQGHTIERRVKQANVLTASGVPCDVITLYKVSPWGGMGWAEQRALVRGTDVPVYAEKPDERVYFDLLKVYECPQYAIDPHGHFGLRVSINETVRSNVTAIFSCRFHDRPESAVAGTPQERVLELARIGPPGFFYHACLKRTFDRAGNLLDESAGEIRGLGAQSHSADALVAEMARVQVIRKTAYRYQAGCFRDGNDPRTGIVTMAFAGELSTNSIDWKVNDAGWREWPTEVNTYRPEDTSAGIGTNFYLSLQLHSPRWVKTNRFMPGITNAWTEWTGTELDDRRKRLFESEIIFNAEGEPSAHVAHKVNGQGQQADKVVYQLPYPRGEDWQTIGGTQAADHLRVDLSGPQDLSSCDFVALYLDHPAGETVTVQFQDSSHRSVLVANAAVSNQPENLAFWPVGATEVLWAPNDVLPQRGAALGAPRSLVREGKVFGVSVPELARAGLDPGQVISIAFKVTKSGPSSIRISPLYRLRQGERFLMPAAASGYYYDFQAHSSGLETYRRTKREPGGLEVRTGRGWSSSLSYENTTLGSLNPRSEPPYYPVLLLADNSDPDLPRPLYSLAADDGRFVNYFQTRCTGNTQVYTVINGFDTPKVEVFRAGVLDDEISPGVLGLGYDYYVTVPMAKSSGGLSGVFARLHNRCVASVFALGADYLVRSLAGAGGLSAEQGQLNRQHRTAFSQARDIDLLPTLAEGLLPTRQTPWSQRGPSLPSLANPQFRTNALRDFYRLSRVYLTDTGLIPTAAGTQAARYINTVQEAEIIELSVKLDRPDLTKLAGELLSFYWDKSQGGTKPLHAFYDAETGASLTKRTEYKRASDAEMTAETQLAVAEAAFCLGTTGDTNALEFGKNLLGLLLDQFRPETNEVAWPRGITENRVKRAAPLHGITRWSEAKTFSITTNVRAYLLLTRLGELAAQYRFAPEWNRTILEAAGEQAAWLTNRVLPFVQSTGVVPKGLFEIQDVLDGQTAFALDRWTATDDWLSFIEAADRIGISRERTRGWLDNLACAHGVTVGSVWGLDWTIPLQRPDAISTALTARFLRVATVLQHWPAAQFVSQSLDQLRQGAIWPVAVTTAPADAPLKTGQGSTLYPVEHLLAGQGRNSPSNSWPQTMGVYAQLEGAAWPTNGQAGPPMETPRSRPLDITQWFWTAAAFYLAIIAVAFFWWSLRLARRRGRIKAMAGGPTGLLVPVAVMRKAEERWAKLVLGLRIPSGAERSRYSNGAVEQNFHIQLRAIYKLVLEWRRVVNNWSEDDERLAEGGEDSWVNAMDEFAAMVGIYSRWVLKAGRKDGLPQADVLQENEDSNHIWSRLVLYFSESHLRLLSLMSDFKANPAAAAALGLNEQMELVLRLMGVRERPAPFDARTGFDAPARGSAMDLLLIQLPGVNLGRVVEEMERKLDIPREHFVSFIKGYKSFKKREYVWPMHPYVLEAAKMLPHFLLMCLVALIWYNNELRGLEIFDYLGESAANMAADWHSLVWAVPLFVGFGLSAAARAMQVYRYRWASRQRAVSRFALDADLTNWFGRATHLASPAMRPEGWWNPVFYQRAGWVFRAIGLALLAISLFELQPPSFATFMFVKGILGVVLLMESTCLLAPLLVSRFSMWLEDRVTAGPNTLQFTRWLSQLNLVPTRPASLIWLSIKYHFQPSVPTGGALPMAQAITSYLGFAALFFFIGSYTFKQALEVWFQEAYCSGRDVGLVLGGFLFWNTMYLLRFGLFILIVTLSSAAAIFPFRVAGALAAASCLGLQFFSDSFSRYVQAHLVAGWTVMLAGLALMALEPELLAWLKSRGPFGRRRARRHAQQPAALERYRLDPDRALGVVYMSGDDLSFHKLTAELLLTRLKILRDQLGSRGIELLSKMNRLPEGPVLAEWFGSLYELEKKSDVTLWHPTQLVVVGEQPSLRADLGLNLMVDNEPQREALLRAWHVRRWLVTMMSTAGHSQDTAINLVDIALALNGEGMGPNVVFYLIQNKYDNNDNNRPSQAAYDKGELGQRNKLARLLMELAPGSRAYNINDWTPFGFKAGGLVGMDLVYEESLKLTNMLLLDRNANANDLDALMADLKLALSDPGAVIVLPGRSTTNVLTPIGQGSQLIEEGQRALLRGVMLLGGNGGESLGTGWGNIQAVYYGRVQRALCDLNTPKMPLSTSGERGASFGERYEGLIGFGPHAVGISEDLWGVIQAAHNALGLGYSIKFQRSQALWHKIRETWSHAEWLAAFPRWSGGYLQMMLDPLMQRINDAGPLSVFAKEIRANAGRFFLGAPAALLSILLMPLAIIWDVSPFVQILILLWNLGLVMNQILTALGFIACLEASGFNRLSGLTGLLGAGIVVGISRSLSPFSLPLLGLAFLAGGFAQGLGRWLYYRGRDLVLFGPQLVIHTLGQVIRQNLEFVLSGASANDARAVNIAFRSWVGPREDRPLQKYQNLVNLRTVVWGVGLLSLLLDLFALANLDFLNVLLLLPSLMFSVSTLVGPFLMQPKPGKDMGWIVWAPKVLGWLASFAFYMLVARFVSLGGWFQWMGIVLCLGVFGRLAMAGLKYAGYSTRIRKTTEHLAHQMVENGLAAAEAGKFAVHIVRGLAADITKTRAALEKSGLGAEAQAAVLSRVELEVLPLLKRPMTDLEQKRWANPRLVCEWSRSFVLGLFTFVWFFVVPMPGLLVFRVPGGSRIAVAPGSVFQVALGVIGAVMAAYLVSLALDWGERRRFNGGGLAVRIQTQYQSFRSLAARLSPLQISRLYAMFTDVQTYFDQQSYAYARRTLKSIEETVKAAMEPKP